MRVRSGCVDGGRVPYTILCAYRPDSINWMALLSKKIETEKGKNYVSVIRSTKKILQGAQ